MVDATIWWAESLREVCCGQVVVIRAVFGKSVVINHDGGFFFQIQLGHDNHALFVLNYSRNRLQRMATLRDYPDQSIEFGGSMSGSQLMVASRDGGIGGWRH